ncbi:sugar ABC transporter ATP-binding protein [Acidobacterium sp. S8]|uniref:sugar ABC transporter ATP-binding protein n=1 Tax=Acidobacterium sp. S8 TaxID=1641854 RepID=UPI00131C8B56|nr:sugar ABC transporter ATP-binding protein [Acidobacterium sp. S8]
MTDLLNVEGVSKHYGGIYALKNACFSLRAGEVHALMGENGAGKSTLARVVAGATRANTATIKIEGQPVAIRTPLDAQTLGIGIIYQELDLFQHQTIAENMVVRNTRFREDAFTSKSRMKVFCLPYLRQVGLDHLDTGRMVSSLSIGEMQLLAIARALSMEARIILMDEPTSSLMDDAVERLFALIEKLKASGVAIVYVSHKMDEIFRICDRITVLRDGVTIDTREIAETNVQEVIEMMVGRKVDPSARSHRHLSDSVLMSVSGLTTKKLKGISFDLYRGEVLGIAGLVGAGRSELGAALFGLDRLSAGTVELDGRAFHPRSATDAMRRGMGLVPEDRKLEGLMMQMSILENGTMAVLPRMQSLGFIDKKLEEREMQSIHTRLALKFTSLTDPVASLSGGNQQKTLLARWLLLNPDVLFLDDPARGIDVAAKQDIYRMIDELAARGKGVLLVSSELPELLRCCDRILVLNNGRLTATLPAATTQECIMTAATQR